MLKIHFFQVIGPRCQIRIFELLQISTTDLKYVCMYVCHGMYVSSRPFFFGTFSSVAYLLLAFVVTNPFFVVLIPSSFFFFLFSFFYLAYSFTCTQLRLMDIVTLKSFFFSLII
jgi:hypothetical protein